MERSCHKTAFQSNPAPCIISCFCKTRCPIGLCVSLLNQSCLHFVQHENNVQNTGGKCCIQAKRHQNKKVFQLYKRNSQEQSWKVLKWTHVLNFNSEKVYSVKWYSLHMLAQVGQFGVTPSLWTYRKSPKCRTSTQIDEDGLPRKLKRNDIFRYFLILFIVWSKQPKRKHLIVCRLRQTDRRKKL